MRVKGVVRKWQYPEASERDLSRSLRSAVKELVEMMRSKTKAMRFDAEEEEIADAESEISEFAKSLALAVIAALPRIGRTVYKFNSKQFVEMAKKTGGKDNASVILLIALGAEGNEPWYRKLYGEWESMTEQSVAKLFSNIVSDWSAKIRAANFTGKNSAQVNELSEQRFTVYSSWANNRASGIIGAWNSRLMRQRLMDAKVDSYIWQGMMDDRERLKHLLWQNKVIKLSEVHPFPGEEYGCRCWAIPNWKGANSENS